MPWYAIHTKPQQEFRAHENLSNQGYQVFLPTCQVEIIQKNRLITHTQALFKRYLFIALDDVNSNWMPIRSTRGVHQLLVWPISKTPIVVKDELIEVLKQQDKQLRQVNLFQAGQILNIVDGALKGMQGLFERLYTMADGDLRAYLLIDFLGKQQTLSVPVSQLKSA